MDSTWKTSRSAALVLLIGVALAGCANLSTALSPALERQIEAARTRADHEALATYYDGQAAAARAQAAEHLKLAASYQAAPAMSRGGASMPAHCKAIAQGYEEIASRFESMAASHRQAAAQAKP